MRLTWLYSTGKSKVTERPLVGGVLAAQRTLLTWAFLPKGFRTSFAAGQPV